MVARWHLDLALLTLGTGMVLLGADRLVRPVVRRHVLAFAGLTAAVLGSWGSPRAWPWLVAAFVLVAWPDVPVPPHPLGDWTAALTVVSLVGVWSAVPDTEPPLVAACMIAPLGLGRLAERRPVSTAGTSVLVVAVLGAVWVGSAGWGAALASSCAVGMVLCAPVALGFGRTPIDRRQRHLLTGIHVVVALVVPRVVMRLQVGWAAAVAVLTLLAVLTSARLVSEPERSSGGPSSGNEGR